MEASVENLYSPVILRQAAGYWNISPEQCRLIGDVENYVYECGTDDHAFILRLTHSSHRNANLIKAELEWMDYLAHQDVPVVAPLLSLNNQFVETIPAQETAFYAVAFEKAKGGLPNRTNPDVWNPTLFRTWGKAIGKMHRATTTYQVRDMSIVRSQWDEEFVLLQAEQLLAQDDSGALDELHRLLAFMRTLPRQQNNFGLIHADVHQSNFFVDRDSISIFDFDDSCYHWLLYDIAVVMYHIAIGLPEAQRQQGIEAFLPHFLEGYEQEYTLAENWREQTEEFIRFREVFMYTWFHNKWDCTALSEGQARFFHTTRQRIESGTSLARIRI